jgi:tetratricopeptide (TPR) repeat protein
MNNLAVHLWLSGDLARADDLYREAEGVAAQFGEETGVRWSRGNQLQAAFTLGRWDEAEEAAIRFIRECESSPHYLESAAREVRALVRLGRGDVEGALADFDRALDLARVARDPQAIVPSLLDYARACAMLDRREQARGLAEEALTHLAEAPAMAGILGNVLGAHAHELGVADRARNLMPEPTVPFHHAAIANLDRDYARAAEVYDGMGAVRFAASARVASAEQLLAAGRRAEAEAELEKALAFYRSVGATFLIREAEGLLAASAQSESA